MKTQKQIKEMYEDIQEQEIIAPLFQGGVLAALDWVLNNIKYLQLKQKHKGK